MDVRKIVLNVRKIVLQIGKFISTATEYSIPIEKSSYRLLNIHKNYISVVCNQPIYEKVYGDFNISKIYSESQVILLSEKYYMRRVILIYFLMYLGSTFCCDTVNNQVHNGSL